METETFTPVASRCGQPSGPCRGAPCLGSQPSPGLQYFHGAEQRKRRPRDVQHDGAAVDHTAREFLDVLEGQERMQQAPHGAPGHLAQHAHDEKQDAQRRESADSRNHLAARERRHEHAHRHVERPTSSTIA